MSNRIYKQKKHSSVFKRMLLSRIIAKSKEILICENCFKRGFRFYIMSPLDSSYCIEYIQSNRSGCDIMGPTAVQFEALSSTYVCFEAELKDALEK